MPITNDNLNKKLYQLLKVQGFDPVPKDSKGQTTPVPDEAEVFRFTFKVDGKPVGPAWITVDSNQDLKVYYDDETMGAVNEDGGEGRIDDFTEFLQQLKQWAQRRQLGFDVENQDHLESDMAQREYMKNKERISEGYYPMGKTASYNDSVPSVKIILQHTKAIQEGEQRFRNIAKIFLENTVGERILAPTTRPGIAKVYARHLAEGGLPHDERWNHIGGLVEEYTKMAGFVRATRGNQFNESAQQLVNEGINHYQSLRETLSRMIGHKGYNAYFESWTPTLMEDETDTDTLNELFVQETMDPRIESVMPILSRIHKKVNEMSEVKSLEEWADNLIGEATDLTSIPEDDLDEGLDPEKRGRLNDLIDLYRDATEPDDYYDRGDYEPEEVIDMIRQEFGDKIASQVEAGADKMHFPRHGIQRSDPLGWKKPADRITKAGKMYKQDSDYMKNTIKSRYKLSGKSATEGVEEGLGDVAKKVGSALKTGAKAVGKAIVGKDDDELLRDLKKRAGVRNPETGKPSMAYSDVEKVDEVDMGQYDAAKSSPKHNNDDQVFKNFREKLRQYEKDSAQPKKKDSEKVDEDLGPEQKRVGQLGPTEKVGKKGAVGKLVGANESVNNQANLVREDLKSTPPFPGVPAGRKEMQKPRPATQDEINGLTAMSKSHTLAPDLMIYWWQDPKLKEFTREQWQDLEKKLAAARAKNQKYPAITRTSPTSKTAAKPSSMINRIRAGMPTRGTGMNEDWRSEIQDIDDWANAVREKLKATPLAQRLSMAQKLSQIENKNFGSELTDRPRYNNQTGKPDSNRTLKAFTNVVYEVYTDLENQAVQAAGPQAGGFGSATVNQTAMNANAQAQQDASMANHYQQHIDDYALMANDDFIEWFEKAKESLLANPSDDNARRLSADQVKRFGSKLIGQIEPHRAGYRDAYYTPQVKNILDNDVALMYEIERRQNRNFEEFMDNIEAWRKNWSKVSDKNKEKLANMTGKSIEDLEEYIAGSSFDQAKPDTNENFINTDAQAVVTEMDKSEDNKGPEGKATPVKAKDFAKDAGKKLNKQMDKAHKKDVKEGQEDLDAILRIIKK